MADTLEELMTDERVPAWQGAYQQGRNDLRAELREPLRALRESHDALRAYVEKRGHQLSCPKVQSVHHACAGCPHACNCGYEAALAKAEALHG